jgi:hypothetical protein
MPPGEDAGFLADQVFGSIGELVEVIIVDKFLREISPRRMNDSVS